ncbi:MAG: MmgE/PrpD family protein [Pusillimonas sp.]
MTQNETACVAREMAGFALGERWDRLPAAVQAEAVRAMLNWTACAVGGARTASMDAAMRGILAMTTSGATPVLGRPEKVSMPDAALLCCLSSSAYTFDDTHLATITHPTGPVAAAALSAAHTLSTSGNPVSGTSFLTSLIVGMELECRVSNAITASGGAHIGWYMTGLSGGIGAAAAVGCLLKLSPEQMTWAIGLAASQACGLRATHGSMAIAYIPAVAARNGLTSAYMAMANFACSDILVDGRNGLLEVISTSSDPTLITRSLGKDYEMLSNAYKPYPCGIVIHPAIDACLQLSSNSAVAPQEIEEVALRVHPDALRLTWRKLPENELDAQVSLYHWAAATLVHNAAGLEQGTLACIMDPEVRALQERMQVEATTQLADNQAVVSLRLKDGSRLEATVDQAIGSVGNPMTNEQLAKKFLALSEPVIGDEHTAKLLDFCLGISGADDVARVFHIGAHESH